MVTQVIFEVPPINKRKRVPMKTIRAFAQHIAEKFNPEQIILFGSHAYGKPTAEAVERVRKFIRGKLGIS